MTAHRPPPRVILSWLSSSFGAGGRHPRLWFLAWLCLWCVGGLSGQERGARESVLLQTDGLAGKQIAAARKHLAAGQWEEAVPLMRLAADQHGDKLVDIAPGRYVSVQNCCDRLLTTLSPSALATLRKRIDPQARRWFEEGAARQDVALLQRVVRQAFISSHGDDALLMLGDLAWERGDLGNARQYWSLLLPAPPPSEPGGVPMQLGYPDAGIEPALVRARLVLGWVTEGKLERGKQELLAFKQQYSEARGTLAGRKGVLAEILEVVIKDMEQADLPPVDSPHSTFAGTPERNGTAKQDWPIGASPWSLPLRKFTMVDRSLTHDVAPYFPVVHDHTVYFSDDVGIYAVNLYTGKPAFAAEESAAGEVLDAEQLRRREADLDGLSAALVAARIYDLPPELQRRRVDDPEVVGVPSFTVTIHAGRLYARLGSVTTRHELDGRRAPRSFLVALDLTREGQHLGTIDAEDLKIDGTSGWAFEGAPVVSGNRVYVSLRSHRPQPQVAIACFDTGMERMVWSRSVCIGATTLPSDKPEISHQLLTLAGNNLYFCTNLGAVAAFDARDGLPLWLTTYKHEEPREIAEWHNRQRSGPNPCLVHQDLVIAAPYDSKAILAFDATSGAMRWQEELDEDAHALLGVGQWKGRDDKLTDRLFIAGDEVWSLDLSTGQRSRFPQHADDPEHAIFGRGLIAGDVLATTSHEKLFLTNFNGKQVDDPITLSMKQCPEGGNLLWVNGVLLVAQGSRLTALWDQPGLRRQRQEDVARRPNAAEPHYDAAVLAEAEQNSAEAIKEYAETLRLVDAQRLRESVPLRQLAAGRLEKCLLREATAAAGAAKYDLALKRLATAEQTATTDQQRARVEWTTAVTQVRAGQTLAAMQHFQRLLTNPTLQVEVLPGRAAPLARLATMRMAELIAVNGPAVYAEFDAALAKAMAALGKEGDKEPSPDAVLQILTQYPLAKEAPALWLKLAENHLAGKQWIEARQAYLKASLSSAPETRLQALLGLAHLAEQQQAWQRAADCWNSLQQEFADAKPPELRGKTIAEHATARLASPDFRTPPVWDGSRPWLPRWEHQATAGTPLFPAGLPPAPAAACVIIPGAEVLGLNRVDGKVRWSLRLNQRPNWAGFVGDALVLGHADGATAVDPTTGRLLWNHLLRNLGSPLQFRTTGDTLCILQPTDTTAGQLASRAPFSPTQQAGHASTGWVGALNESGELLWSVRPGGELQQRWFADRQRVVIQTQRPGRIFVLAMDDGTTLVRLANGSLIRAENAVGIAAANHPWLTDPLPVAENELALLPDTKGLELFDVRKGTVRWSRDEPGYAVNASLDVLATPSLVLPVRDGMLGIALRPQDGTALWTSPRRLAAAPVPYIHEVACLRGDHLFVPAAGILRSYNITTGHLLWEQSLGNPKQRWAVRSAGNCLAAYPTHSTGTDTQILLCDPGSGTLVQRLRLALQGQLEVHAGTDSFVVTAGTAVVGFSP